MKIRSYQKEDQEIIINLWIVCGLVVPHNNPVRDIVRKLSVNPKTFLVGTIKNEIVATCMVGYEGHRGVINYLAVKPELQKQGLGRELMNYAEALLIEKGCPKINLLIRTTNTQVISFYESLGYKADQVVSMGKRLIPDSPYIVEEKTEV